MQDSKKEPWTSPELKRVELSEEILDRIAPEASTPEQQERIAELRRKLKDRE